MVDCAMAPLAGLTSQPSLQAVAEALRFQERDTGLDAGAMQLAADYWQEVRRFYAAFETGQLSPQSDVYRNEMPGGQYTNLYQQAQALGLEPRWPEVCQMYAEVNRLFGDIIKVTPTSKVVGDMALFMVGNNLQPRDVARGHARAVLPRVGRRVLRGPPRPAAGRLPRAAARRVLRGRPALDGRPGATLPPIDFAAARADLQNRSAGPPNDRELLAYLMYPRVLPDLIAHQAQYSDTSVLPTPVFFHGMSPGEETSIDIEGGKTLIVKFLTVGEPHADGTRTLFFELNGQPREVVVQDRSLGASTPARRKAEPGNPLHVAAPMPGLVVRVSATAGETVTAGQKLFSLEAMKMETTLQAERARRGGRGARPARGPGGGGGPAVALLGVSHAPPAVGRNHCSVALARPGEGRRPGRRHVGGLHRPVARPGHRDVPRRMACFAEVNRPAASTAARSSSTPTTTATTPPRPSPTPNTHRARRAPSSCSATSARRRRPASCRC